MLRKRQQPESQDSAATSRNEKRPKAGRTCLGCVLARNPRTLLLVTALSAFVVYRFVRAYYALELYLDDPFLEAMLITPFRYAYVRYVQSKPMGPPRHFVMRRNNTFVISLDADVHRFEHFRRTNARGGTNGTDEYYQRHPAFRWIPSQGGRGETLGVRKGAATVESEGPIAEPRDDRERQQKRAMKRYPFLRRSSRRGEWGTAGCTYSHIQLLERLVAHRPNESNGDYYFIFEDDARLSPEFVEEGVVKAPPDADIAFLIETNTKTVRVPYGNGEDGYAIRILQSYGSFAYVITARGANKLLKHLGRRRSDDPIDVAMHRASGMRMYQPTKGWPQARHGTHASSRHSANRGN